MSESDDINEYSVDIEKEKTKRTYAWLILFGIISILTIALFFQNVGEGKLVVSQDGIEVTIDKPLVEQVGLETTDVESDGESINFTSGTISDSLVEAAVSEQKQPLLDNKFVGKNLIDRTNGFVLASEDPSSWKLSRSSEGATLMSMKAGDGTTVDVDRIESVSGKPPTIKSVVDSLSRPTAGFRIKMRPKVTYDASKSTALLVYTDARTGKESYVKVTSDKNGVYVARADISKGTSKAVRSDAIKAVTSFSLIE